MRKADVLLNHRQRLRRLRLLMKQEQIEALVVTHLADVRYLCGFSGSNAFLCITANRASLFTDGRYIEQARQETNGVRVVIAKSASQPAYQAACLWLQSSGAAHCAFDPEHTTVAELARYRKSLSVVRRRGFFRPLAESLVFKQRIVKDADELHLMQEAASLGATLFHDLLPLIRSGIAETALAGQLELSARLHGADGMSFETIVAGGPRSSRPHGRATAKLLPRRGFVTLDFGVILKGYCSDMTRTLFLGRATRQERFTYDSVREAQQAAVQAVKPGVSCGEVDEAARSVLRKAGLAQYFTHSTGHGVGLEIHEQPRIAAAQQQTLVPGMVITIEPGVYIPGRFGVRIEDMVAVTESGAQVLTQAPTAWMQF